MVIDDFDASTSTAAETPAPAPAQAEAGADTSAGVSDPGSGACSPETLQDFVLNIINDPLAKAAYLANPGAALSAAGLDDLTAADVQEVLPLVADSVPADLTALPVVGDLPTDGLLGDLPAVGGLTDALPVGDLGGLTGGLPVELPELGALPTSGLPLVNDLPAGVPGLGELPVDLSAIQLPQVPSLDTPLGDVTTTVDGVAGAVNADVATGGLLDLSASGFLSNPENDAAPTLSATVDSLVGEAAAGAKLTPEEFGGSANFTSDLVDVGGGLVGHAGGDTGVWGGANTPLGDVAVGGLLSPEDGVALAAKTPLADVTVSNTEFSIQPADTSDLLDVDHLGSTGDAITGTVAGYVSAGAGIVADGVDSTGDTLGGYLTGSLGTVGDTLESTTDTVSGTVGHGGDLVSDQVSNLPSVTDALPLDQLPELPELPDLPDVSSDDLSGATDLTSHLPAVSLPDTGSLTDPVTDLVSNSAVGDVVHDGPVGGLVEGVTGHLPQVGDVAGLDLGL